MNAAELMTTPGALANNNLLLWLLMLVSLLCVVLAVLLMRLQRLNRQCRAQHELREQDRQRLTESHQLLRHLIDHLPQLIAAKDQQGVYIECNQSYLNFLGLSRDAVVGKRTRDVFTSNDIHRSMEEQDEQVRLSKSSHSQSRWLAGADNELRLISTQKLPLVDSADRLWGVLSISEDTTAENQMRQIDKHRNRVLEQLAQGAPLLDIFNELVTFTEELYPGLLCSILLLDDRSQTLQLGAAPSLPDFYNKVVHGIRIGEGVGSCGTAAFTGRPVLVSDIQNHPYWRGFEELTAKAGLAACWSLPIKNRQGKVLGTFAIYYTEPADPTPDQMELMMVNAHLAAIAIEAAKMDEQLSQLSQAVEHSASFVVIADSEQRMDYVNHSLMEATGYRSDQLKGQPINMLAADDEDPELQESIRQTVQQGEIWHGERRFKGLDGQGFWVMSSVAPIRNADNEVTHLVCVSEDITALKQEQERMARLAFYDPLTGLANRRLFKDRLDVALKQAQRQQQSLALIYLDLDRFKAVNDEHGHEVGDELLKEVALRLQQTLRESDVIARIGGDEFNIILPDVTDSDAAEQVADKVLQAVVEPFVTGDIELKVSASIGLTLYPDDGVDAKQLIKNADVAMYRSKAQGRNCRLRYTA
ncbi:diguanylate cyclase domain-containing protein [Oceanospirillum sanctuarii]|uniref:diguanylate cyclase domain-containing protein n=1 Tax=Oceanospirillum sanctuarii TaxID=1434821 RepID=UPI000A3AE1DB|nr:diguanylate cyclase [Oceanospirillum sanctuarii]